MISEREFADIVSGTKQYVLSAIAKNLPERFSHSIDDIVQETYFRAFRSLAKGAFRNESKVSTWIYVIARNETLRMAGRLAREEQKAQREIAKRMEEFHEEIESDDTISRAIGRLSKPHKEVMELFMMGLKEKEISLKLNIPGGTVKSRLNRARENLRRELSEVHYERD